MKISKKNAGAIGSILLVSILSFLTFFWQPSWPNTPILDERFYITDAQRYLHGIFFIKHNPPLGKLLLAAGEGLFGSSRYSDLYLNVELASNVPDDFPYTGYRFFPTLLAWLTSPLLFLILLRLTQRPLIALIGTLPFIFDNALISQMHSAMLEGPLLFFIALSLLTFLLKPAAGTRLVTLLLWSILLGTAMGLAASVKFAALILLLLMPAHVWRMRLEGLKQLLLSTTVILAALLLTYIAVWQIHFSTATGLSIKTPSQPFASEEYKELLKQGNLIGPRPFAIMMRDTMEYTRYYNGRVPTVEESGGLGSYAWTWPFGWKPMATVIGGWGVDHVRLLVIIPNPIAWWSGLAAVLAGIGFFLASMRKRGLRTTLDRHLMLLTLTGMYASYLFVMSTVERSLYLYHYMPPLLFSFVIFGLVIKEVADSPYLYRHRLLKPTLFVWVALLLISYQYLYPLTYYQPMHKSDPRATLWELLK